MILWNIVTISLCKVIYWILRKTGRHGAALPGLIAEKLNSGLIHSLTNLPEGIVVVSGTNGKTTTTHLVSEVLRRMNKRVFTNHSGSNMTRGLLASIIRYCNFRGQLNFDVAVLEIDEAYAAKLAPILRPRACIITNVLRDQLDRFGEIDFTAKLLYQLADATTGVVVYNATDGRLQELATNATRAKLVSYGFAKNLVEFFPDDDALYDSHNRKLPEKFDYVLESMDDSIVKVSHHKKPSELRVGKLPGWHNAFNLTAVYALVNEVYENVDTTVFQNLEPPYGRGETIKIGGKEFILQLVKNPAGFRTAMSVARDAPALVVINDAIADGRDVSWLWDLDLTPMAERPIVATAGTRAYDMALRLKYDDIPSSYIEPDEDKAINQFFELTDGGVLFLTYTAMLHCRRIMKRLAH